MLLIFRYSKNKVRLNLLGPAAATFASSSSKGHSSSSSCRKIVFFGGDTFSIPSLSTLVSSSHSSNPAPLPGRSESDLLVVVSNQNNIVGKFARKRGLECVNWEEFKEKGYNDVKDLELGVVASFGHLIPKRVIERFRLGMINVHASLLPRWRGAAPIAHAIMSGDKVTGISIMKIAPHKFDIGPVLYKREVPIPPHILRPELTEILANVGAQALHQVLSHLDHYLSNPIPQNEEEAKLSPKLVPEMAEVRDWGSRTALDLYNLYRGLYGMFKLKSYFRDKPVDLDEISLVRNMTETDPDPDDKIYTPTKSVLDKLLAHQDRARVPGEIVFINDMIFVKCKEEIDAEEGQRQTLTTLPYLLVRKVKVGNKWMSGKDFQNGFLSKCSKVERLFVKQK